MSLLCILPVLTVRLRGLNPPVFNEITAGSTSLPPMFRRFPHTINVPISVFSMRHRGTAPLTAFIPRAFESTPILFFQSPVFR